MLNVTLLSINYFVFTWFFIILFLHLCIANYLFKMHFALGIIISKGIQLLMIFYVLLSRNSSQRLLLNFGHVAHGQGLLLSGLKISFLFFFINLCAKKLTFCINFRKKKLCPLDRSSLNPRSRTVSIIFEKINIYYVNAKMCQGYIFIWS